MTATRLSFDDVWRPFRETDRKFQETDRLIKELYLAQKKTEAEIEKMSKAIGRLGNRRAIRLSQGIVRRRPKRRPFDFARRHPVRAENAVSGERSRRAFHGHNLAIQDRGRADKTPAQAKSRFS